MKYYCLFIVLICSACQNDVSKKSSSYVMISGKTMGTYYRISLDKKNVTGVGVKQMDSLLLNINAALSTYEEHSIISQFNKFGQLNLSPIKRDEDGYFIDVYNRALEIFDLSNGDFDPTVMPLVNYWGFGYKNTVLVNEGNRNSIDSLLKFVSFDKIHHEVNDTSFIIFKDHDAIELDFSAIAKGYGVDVIGRYLIEKGIADFLVDIGGEMMARGKNKKGVTWTIGINRPLEDASISEIELIVKLENMALASSGNYRNFYESNGKKYSHTINPKTGYPERSSLLSVSVVTDNAMDADAFATACMVKGLADSKDWIEELKGVEACFIYNNNELLDVSYSSGFNSYLIENKNK